MPLSEKARIEVYLPDLPKRAYQDLLDVLEQEFTHTFGGCTIMRDLDGSYLSRLGLHVRDRVNLIYADGRFLLDEDFKNVARYTDELRAAASAALEEEVVLVAVFKVYHSE